MRLGPVRSRPSSPTAASTGDDACVGVPSRRDSCSSLSTLALRLLILANSIILGLPDYSEVNKDGSLSDSSLRNRVTLESELVFTILFTIECFMKITAMGFVWGKGSYLRDAWNVLDFVVVMGGCVAAVSRCLQLPTSQRPCHFPFVLCPQAHRHRPGRAQHQCPANYPGAAPAAKPGGPPR